MRQLLRRLWYAIRQRQVAVDLAEELAFHRTMKQREFEEHGEAPQDAARASRRALGSVALAQDRVRDVWCPPGIQGIAQDLRFAVRSLRATPVVTGVAILSLALGIGANTAIFSLVNSLVLRTLPVVEPQRLAIVSGDARGLRESWTFGIWEQLRRRSGMFDGALAWSAGRFSLANGEETEPVDGLFTSSDFFATLGVPALLGRTFTAADDIHGGGPNGAVAVISYNLWQRRFGGAFSALGSTLVVDRVPFTVVGVTPPTFFGTEVGRTFDVALPIGTEPLIHGAGSSLVDDQRGYFWLRIVLRLKPGQSLDTATAALRGLQPQIRDAAMPPQTTAHDRALFLTDPLTLIRADAGTSDLRVRYQRPLLTLLVVVGLVLLIACANIANLLLARATARKHEWSVRLALGASTWRLTRQLLLESLMLSSIGAAGGLAFAAWGSRALVTRLSTSVDHIVLNLPLDWRVLAFTAAITVTTTVLFGTAPALRATLAPPIDALKKQGRGASTETHMALSNGLVIVQVALSLVLVVAAGLFVRTFAQLATRPLGFETERVLVVNVNPARAHVDVAHQIQFYDRLVEAVAALPGVAHAGGSVMTPVSRSWWNDFVDVSDAPTMTERERVSMVNGITPGWFAAYGTPLLRGRDFDRHDTRTTPPVVVVNEAFARRFFPGRNPIGGTVALQPHHVGEIPIPKTIVGVVADAVYISLRQDLQPTLYVPLAQMDGSVERLSISVRASTGAPMLLSRNVAAALASIDRDLLLTFRPLAEQVNASLIQERLVAMLSGFFGGLALLLAGLGLYGVMSYAVSRRRTELGIRMALGAAPSAVVQLVLARVVLLVSLGIVIGGAVSLWASTFVATLLYGLEPRDPATLAGAVVVLATVGALAASVPAWRASHIDPAVTLRYD
jgi:putative ABC transport system permease protein